MDTNAIIRDIEIKTGIKTSVKGLERILAALKTTNNYWSIIRMSRETVPVVAHVLRYMKKMGYIDEGLNLTLKGEKLVVEWGVKECSDYTCSKCAGRGIEIAAWDEVLNDFKRITDGRPKPIQEYDQGYVTPETTIARLMFADMNNDLYRRDIFIIGDDDLLSIGAMLTQYPKTIGVLEIDNRLTSFIEKVARDLGVDVAIYTMDLRDPLPDELLMRFDTFFTDPPETMEALKLFIERGIASLKGPYCAGYFGITNAESSIHKRYEFQKYLSRIGVMITDIIGNFNYYINWDYYANTPAYKLAPTEYGPEEIWYMSNFYRIETMPNYKVNNEPVNGEIYLDNESTTR